MIVSTSISAGEQTIDSVFNIANNFLYGVMSVEGEKGVNQMDGYIEKGETLINELQTLLIQGRLKFQA